MRVSVTNNEPAGELLAQEFYVSPAGETDGTPVESRVIHPGITAILNIRGDNALVLQRAPRVDVAATLEAS